MDIDTLSRPATLAQALSEWSGTVQLAGPQVLGPSRGLTVLPRGPEAGRWDEAYRRLEPVPALRCHFLQGVSVCGDGYVFAGGRLLTQPSYISKVAEGGARRFFADRPVEGVFTRVVLDAPALVAIGPGWQVFGHWLLDFLPRVAIARTILRERFGDFRIVLPKDVPDFVQTMLGFFLNVPATQLVHYDRDTEILVTRQACVPDYAHHNYALHTAIRRFYRGFVNGAPALPERRICVSRKRIESTTRSAMRFFHQREEFEAMAVARGFELVFPEDLSFAEQIKLMAETSAQVGEHGSAQHAAIFAAPDTIVGTVHPQNNVQMQIGRLCNQRSVFTMADRHWLDDGKIIHFTASTGAMRDFLDVVERVGGGRKSR